MAMKVEVKRMNSKSGEIILEVIKVIIQIVGKKR